MYKEKNLIINIKIINKLIKINKIIQINNYLMNIQAVMIIKKVWEAKVEIDHLVVFLVNKKLTTDLKASVSIMLKICLLLVDKMEILIILWVLDRQV
jgi:hypothetical protein